MPATHLTDAEIIARCQSGEFVDDIGRHDADIDDPDSLVNRSVALHNAGAIDLLSLTKTSKFNSLAGSAFFDLQQFFYKAIPRLETNPRPLMEAVQSLVAKGGNDLAANRPNEAFITWCATDPKRSNSIIAGAQAGDALSIEFATFALTALGDTELARSFATNFSDKRNLAGMSALGRLKPSDLVDADKSIGTLLPYLDARNDEASRINSLIAALNICKQFPSLAGAYLPKAIATAIIAPTPSMQYNLAHAIWDHLKLFDRDTLRAMLDALAKTDPAMKGIVEGVDFSLERVLATPNADLAEDFLGTVLAAETGFTLELFPSTRHAIASGDRDRLFRLVVRWLTSDNSYLEGAVPQLLRGEDAAPFNASTESLGLSGPDHIFLARKAIGWLLVDNTVAASILVACLRGCDSATASTISALLFDPLLANFSGGVRTYLKTIRRGDLAHRHVKKALKEADGYAAKQKLSTPIKELRPSEHQRNIIHRHQLDWMREVRKGAEKQSVFMSLVHRSTLLYGRRSITFVHEPGGKRRTVGMDLHSFSHSFELPEWEITDPVGLSIMLLKFRSAKKP